MDREMESDFPEEANSERDHKTEFSRNRTEASG